MNTPLEFFEQLASEIHYSNNINRLLAKRTPQCQNIIENSNTNIIKNTFDRICLADIVHIFKI